MRTLFYKLAIIFSAVLIWFEIIFGAVVPRMVKKSNDSYINRWSKFYKEKSGAEIVCLGSSRVHRHCNPEIISNITHLTTEVIAEPGAKIDMFERLYKDYLKINPRPKILMVGIDLSGLDSVAYLPYPEQFFPSINRTDRISEMPEFNLLKYHKPLGYFYYKELYLDMAESPVLQQHKNGFLVRDEKWDGALEDIIGKYPNGFSFTLYRPTVKRIFQLMADERKAGVQCIGFIAPEYQEVWKYENNRSAALALVYQYADSVGIPVWNFSDSLYKPCFNRELFYNSQHLNKKGSSIFSSDLSDSILRYCSVGNK